MKELKWDKKIPLMLAWFQWQQVMIFCLVPVSTNMDSCVLQFSLLSSQNLMDYPYINGIDNEVYYQVIQSQTTVTALVSIKVDKSR